MLDNQLKKAEELFLEEKYKESKETYESIIHLINNRDAEHTYGICLVRLKEYNKAINVFNNIIKKYGEEGDVWYSLGRTYLIVDDINKAINCLNKAKQLIPNNSKVFLYLGIAHEKLQNTDMAIKNYIASLNLEEYYETHINLGLCYYDIQELSLALKHTKRAFEIENKNLDSLRYYVFMLVKTNQREEAYKLLLDTSLSYDEDASILETFILLALNVRDFKKADKAYERLKSINPTHPTVGDYKMLKTIATVKNIDVFKC